MKRNTLTTAVLAGLTGVAGMAGVANAVNVNPDGLGQVLLFPYYTARGGNDTYVHIVNTSDRGKAVKIRFIEALNSREVLDFNIYMSPFDVWTSVITPTSAGGGKMVTRDTTCTVPYFVGDAADAAGVAVGSAGAPAGEQEFLDYGYASAPIPNAVGGAFAGTIDGGPTGIERTLSGYIEVIEMASFVGTQPTSLPAAGNTGRVAWWAKHVMKDGAAVQVPNNCDAIVDLWRPVAEGATITTLGALGTWKNEDTDGDGPVGGDVNWGLDEASGGLYGSATIINPTKGLMFSYNPTAIDGFWAAGSNIFHTDPGDIFPNLADATNDTSFAFVQNDVLSIDWPVDGPLAVNAVLTVKSLLNEYTVLESLAAQTEWVLTFPTKGFHVDTAPGRPNSQLSVASDPILPFKDTWTLQATNGTAACETLEFDYWDREEMINEEPPGEPGGVIVSPPPPPGTVTQTPTFDLCREANVIRIVSAEAEGAAPTATEILGEPTRENGLGYTNLNLPEGFGAGWIQFNFDNFYSEIGTAASEGATNPNLGDNTVRGLPVIGFAVTTYENSQTLGAGVIANYGGTFQHRGTREAVTSR